MDDEQLEALVERLEECELDDYTKIKTLVALNLMTIPFREQLTILELKLLIYLALEQFEEAKDLVEAFLQYNTNTVERGLFYQCMNVVLEVILDDEMDIADYEVNFRRMFGNERMDAVMGSVEGTVRFYGLTETNMQLEGFRSSFTFNRQLQKTA